MNAFRKSLLLIFCLRLLLSGGTVAELFKLPALIGHYLHHCQTEKHTFVDFLKDHYGSHDHHDQNSTEHQAHHKLPFSGHHPDGMKEPAQPFILDAGLKYLPIDPSIPENPLVYMETQWHSQFSPSFWQPPKLA
ncbi:MAG TPA: hypothetical protein PLS51_11935 [Flavobacterium sp.]|nr:hypothetical protein [Flavobacterium sp.]